MADINSFLKEASKLRIAVVGDLIVDKYIFGNVTRISPEGPIPIVNVTGTRENPGGAGNVVENLKGLGVQVSSFYGKHVPIKTRVMSGNHHVIRIDEEEDPCWMRWDDIDIGLGYGILYKKFDCIVISDYGKGMISDDVVDNLIRECVKNKIPVVVDSKKDFQKFRGATILKCNHHEFERADLDGRSPTSVFEVEYFVITSGADGISYECTNEFIGDTGGLPISICDPCGAGDTVTAVLAIAQSIGLHIGEACELANIAASEVCRHAGVYAIQKNDLIKRFNEVQHG